MNIDIVLITWPNHPKRIEYFKRCVKALKSNLRASKHDLIYKCVAEEQVDPTCTWCGDQLVNICKKEGIILRWHPAPAGLGRNMNFAMDTATSPTYFMVQDDWEMIHPCDISLGASFLEANQDVCMIRYSWPSDWPTFIPMEDGWRRIDINGKWPYGDDPSLKRHDFTKKYGRFVEDCPHGVSEGRMLHNLVRRKADIRANDVCCFGHMGLISAIPDADDPRGYPPRRTEWMEEHDNKFAD